MKIFFVGIHNKPDMSALDSKSKSGKAIDDIAQLLAGCDIVKTNLCNCNYQPDGYDEIRDHARRWHQRNHVSTEDVIVLLGEYVQRYFSAMDFTIIKLSHPGYAIRKNAIEAYIIHAARRIIIDVVSNSFNFYDPNIES